MNIGNGNEFLRFLNSCQNRRFYAEKVINSALIHKNEINDYSSAFRTPQYRLIFATIGKAKIAKIG